MPTFDITAPDGRKFTVTAPDGATQESVLAYAKENMPASPKAEAEDPGALMAGVIGTGRMLDRGWQGVKQAALETAQKIAPSAERQAALDRQQQQQDENTRIYAGLQERRPLTTMAGEVLPLIAALPVVGGIGSAAALGALPGAIEYGSVGERATRAGVGAVGGALGAGAGKLVGRALSPIRALPSETQAAAQAAADRIGVQLRPGEIIGSRPLRWLESSLNDLPFSGGMAQAGEKARREAMNSAAARALGQQAPELTEGVLASARQNIGSTFDTLLANRRIPLDQTFRNEVKAITDSKVLPALRDESVDAVIAPFRNLPNAPVKVTGEWFQQNKTALDAAIRGAYTAGQNGKAQALEGFENALVDAAKRSMTGAERNAFEQAQKQWASLRLLETGKVVEGGNVMPGRLDTALTTRYKAAYKEGKIPGDLTDIGKLAQVYKPLPQSGTAPRAIYSGLAGGAMFANPMAAVAALAAPPAVQKFLQSDAGRRYLTSGLLAVTPELERKLVAGGFGLLGAPMATMGAGLAQ